MQGELSLCDTPPACIYSTRNYLSHLDIPCWYFSIRPSYLPSAMSWTSWSAHLSSLALNLPKVLANHTNQSNSETLVAAGCRTVNDNKIDFAGHKIRFFRGYTTKWACNSGLPEFPEQLLLRLQRFLESLRFWSNLLLSFL